jgi:hypothetical protein
MTMLVAQHGLYSRLLTIFHRERLLQAAIKMVSGSFKHGDDVAEKSTQSR